VRLQKDWRSPIYAFFNAEVKISYDNGRKVHEFTCSARHCKGRGQHPRTVRRYLDTKDKSSTSSLHTHAISCWGKKIVDDAAASSNIASARKAIGSAELKDGEITAVFERTGKGKISYSHRQHTREETRLVFGLTCE
jgi:hypothetical protein